VNYGEIRRIVEEEIRRHVSRAPSNARVRRPVITENLIVQSWRRGARELEVTPGAVITPAARERARRLGVHILETMTAPETSPSMTRLAESVMAAVMAELENRPRAEARHVPSRRVLTAADVELARMNEPVIAVGRKTRVTPLARDLVEKYGLKIRIEGE